MRSIRFGNAPRARWWRRNVAVTLVAALAATACGQDEPPPELPPRSIAWQRVTGEVTGEQRVISGIVTAISDTLLAFEVAGIVQSVEVNLGDEVKRDQILARLDPEPLELAVRDAEAALSEGTALLENARADAARTQALFDAAVASRQELERDVARRDSRKSQVEAAEARLALARRDLRRSELRAPFDGSISVREVEPAMAVAAGQTVFEMDSGESGLRVEVQMPETLIARVRQGDRVTVRFPSIGDGERVVSEESFEATVSEVGTRAGTGNAFPVRADLASPPEGLRPGMTAEVAFALPHDDPDLAAVEGFMIPLSASLPEADNTFSVFVYDPQTSTVSKREIRRGGLRDNLIAVVGGLEEGDIIATAGVTFLRDGQQVTLLDERLIRNQR